MNTSQDKRSSTNDTNLGEANKVKPCKIETLRSDAELSKSEFEKDVLLENQPISKQSCKFACEICNKGFKFKYILVQHYLVHGPMEVKAKVLGFVCEICNKTFGDKSALQQHSTTHSNVTPHICEVCNKGFKRKYYLTQHYLTHTGEKPYVCQVCNKSFSQNGNLAQHYNSHSDIKPHICKGCNRAFSLKCLLNQHSALCRMNPKCFTCQVCRKQFRSKYHLAAHENVHSSDKLFICELCDKSFKYQKGLARHYKTHVKKEVSPLEDELMKVVE